MGSSSSEMATEISAAPIGNIDRQTALRSEAYHAFLMGQIALGEEDFESALKSFDRASAVIEEPAPILHIRRAELHVRSGDLNRALEASKQALAEMPDNLNALLLHAGILEALQRDSEAEPIYRSLISKNVDSLSPYVLLASLYARGREFTRGVEILQKWMKTHPKDPTARYYMARIYEAQGDLHRAEEILAALSEQAPEQEQIGIDYLRVLVRLKKLEAAERVCLQILERNPKNAVARRVMGQLLLNRNQLEAALPHLQVLEAMEEDPSDTRFKMALIHIERQNFPEAVRELSLVLAKNPKNGAARYYLGSIYAGSGRRKEAVIELLNIEPTDEMFVKGRMFAALILRQEGDLPRAETAAREALNTDPTNRHLLTYVVMILREQGKARDARVLLEGALESAPDDEKLLYAYANVLAELQEVDQAITIMERVVERNPKHADALNFVAYSLAERGYDLERASELPGPALAVKPMDPFLLDSAGWIAFRRQDYVKAEQLLEQASRLSGGDTVIMEHYGEALLARQKSEQAMRVFALAVDQAEDGTADAERKQSLERIKKRLRELAESQRP